MIIDGHVKFRFVQRVIGIKEEREINRFIEENEFEVAHRILEFVNASELLIENYAPARKDTLDYYINNETLIIMKPNRKELVTLFDITLDANNEQNSIKIKQFVKAIKVNNREIKKINIRQSKQDVISKHLEYMINYLDGEISDYKRDSIKRDLEHSINICKEYAAKAKGLRMENREMMSEMFKKLDKSS